MDAERLFEMNSIVYRDLVPEILSKGGNLVFKFWQLPEIKDLTESMKNNFAKVRTFKPQASRNESSEMYLIATGYSPEN